MEWKPVKKGILRRMLPWLVLLAVLAGFAAAHGLAASQDIGYEIMNGDFQNYNPVRRLLAGQTPYRDFAVYLGAGELYSVSAILLFIGNSFGRSMFATNFLTWFFFEVLILAVCTVVLGRARAARGATMVLSAYFFAVVSGVPLPFSAQAGAWLGYAAQNGNSARMMRSAALPIAVLLIAAGLHHWQAKGQPGGRRLLRPDVLVPLVAGALVPWSNDMGAALYIAIALGYGLFLIRVYRTHIAAILRKTLQFIGVSILGLGAAVLLVSWGHPLAWLLQTRGISSYQAWYYGTAPEGKLYYLSELQPDLCFWLCLGLALVFAIGIFRCKSARSAVLAAGGFALTLGMALWNLLYCVLSSNIEGPLGGGQALMAAMIPALAVRGGMMAAERLRGASVRKALQRGLPVICAAVGCLGVVGGLWGELSTRQAEREAAGLTYVAALGGWTGDQADKLATEQSIQAGRTVWSTYASALEAMTGQFQPSGTDYIIHVMGDRQRLAYLQQFQAGGFDLVETPSPKVSSSERWSRNANWWFYRELYRYWQPVGTTYACGGMHLFWERTGVDNDLAQPCTVAVDQDTPDHLTLTVTTQDPTFCGVADLHLEYRFSVADNFRLRGGLGSFLHLTAVTENQLCEEAGRDTHAGDFFLPTDRGVYDVPVTIREGTGVVELTALPGDAATIEVTGASVSGTFTDWEYFFE